MVVLPLIEPFTVADEAPFANCSGFDTIPSAAMTAALATTRAHATIISLICNFTSILFRSVLQDSGLASAGCTLMRMHSILGGFSIASWRSEVVRTGRRPSAGLDSRPGLYQSDITLIRRP